MTTNHAPKPPLCVGLFGIGLDTYWPQSAGLKESLGRKTHKEVGGNWQRSPSQFCNLRWVVRG